MGRGAFSIGSIAGIRIALHPSWLVIAFLVTYSLAVGELPSSFPGWDPPLYWVVAAAVAALFFASVLAHELTHCGQYQAWGPLKYFTKGAIAQLRHLLFRTLRIGSSPYWYRFEPGKPFEAYGMEQQGQIVEDCFRGHPAAQALSPFQPGRSG